MVTIVYVQRACIRRLTPMEDRLQHQAVFLNTYAAELETSTFICGSYNAVGILHLNVGIWFPIQLPWFALFLPELPRHTEICAQISCPWLVDNI